jgi:hypothetical protein
MVSHSRMVASRASISPPMPLHCGDISKLDAAQVELPCTVAPHGIGTASIVRVVRHRQHVIVVGADGVHTTFVSMYLSLCDASGKVA